MRRILLILSAAICVSVCSLAQSGSKTLDPEWIVPPNAAQQRNPLAANPEAAKGGAKLFGRMCASCHGDESHGQKNNAPDLRSPSVQQETDGSLFWRIKNGNSRKGMPSFSSLPEAQRWQLVMYIRALATDTKMTSR